MTYLLLAIAAVTMLFAPESFFSDHSQYAEIGVAILIALVLTPWVRNHLEE